MSQEAMNLDRLSRAWQNECDGYVMIGHDYQSDLQPVIAPLAHRIRQSRSKTVIRFVEAGNRPMDLSGRGTTWTDQIAAWPSRW
jgi:hypothetical protein